MIYDELGLPKDNGASDLQDSARLAGLLTVFNIQNIPLERYVTETKYVRHPKEIIYNFSRDQAVCLIAGLSVQGKNEMVKRNLIDGKDVMSPSVLGHIRRCQGKKALFFQDWWLWVDVLWSCKVTPMGEPNQLLCILMLADKKFLKFWLKNNKSWKESIVEYWSGWRGEKEFAEHMIKTLEAV